ncbi:MAG: NADH-quinone oxidoreductase subunit N [marine bacterium B5-7]|nr:MAG: NADH-quinone oxidoreductase subunit N [marine bacterium B5-7]
MMQALAPIFPEIILSVTLCVALLATVYGQRVCRCMPLGLTMIGLAATFAMICLFYPHHLKFGFDQMLVFDPLSGLLKAVMVLFTGFVFVLSRRYVADREMPSGEFYVLASLSLLGMMFMVSSNHFLVLYLGLELHTLPLMAMVALRRDSANAHEAAIKYFALSALASGMLLYGVSLLYGATGHLDFVSIAQFLQQQGAHNGMLLSMSLVFIVVSLAFKLGMVPFHMWVPDVYDGAPTAVTLFMSSVPKIAGLGLAMRVLGAAMPSMAAHWQSLFIIMAVLSMLLGNLIAIAQTNIRRLLAYSSIAHMGYLSLGLIAATPEGFRASVYYGIVYALMSLSAFGVLVVMSKQGVEINNVSDLKGLAQRNRWLALLMLFIVFSMAGIPPFVGFFAKLTVLMALVHAHFVWLAVFALACAIIGAYYYLRLIRVMYFEAPAENTFDTPIHCSEQGVLNISAVALLVLGVMPSLLLPFVQGLF